MYNLILLLVFLTFMEFLVETSILRRKFVYQKDVSEHCRRRVVPSVFLGRHVQEANAQMLHFSKMALPYSCFISVRTESGSNIILVTQMKSDKNLMDSCHENGNQLLVYEMSETFGGYWGPLPENMLRQKSNTHARYHTLKTTHLTMTSDLDSEESEEEIATETTEAITEQTKQPKDVNEYIRVEIPLVDVSGTLVPDEMQPHETFDSENSFDLIYDVTPRSNEKYDTSIMPLVRFSMSYQDDNHHRINLKKNHNQLNKNLKIFTPDIRLTFPYFLRSTQIATHTFNKKNSYGKYNSFANRHLKFRNNKTRTFFKKRRPYLKNQFTQRRSSSHTTKGFNLKKNVMSTLYNTQTNLLQYSDTNTEINVKPNHSSLHLIDDIIKAFNKTLEIGKQKEIGVITKNESSLLQNISNLHYNFSAYLFPKFTIFNYNDSLRNPIHVVTKPKMNFFTKQPFKLLSQSTNVFHKLKNTLFYSSLSHMYNKVLKENKILNFKNTQSMTKTGSVKTNYKTTISNTKSSFMEMGISTTDSYKNIIKTIKEDGNRRNFDLRENNESTIYNSTYVVNTTTKSFIGSMVNHKSLRDVVQEAPVMAVILNQTVIHENNNKKTNNRSKENNVTKESNQKVIKKRYIQSIPIENARPHPLRTTENISPTPVLSLHQSNLQEFAQLIELQDDEFHSRVALRYPRQYVGPSLYNICDYREPKSRHVLLFNSSRIVLVINSFTMERLTVVVTTARTLYSPKAQCPSSHLECQVSGARVCIDSNSACDGVLNCGAYDIYDEDRLLCGATTGLYHNVCLAAITFLVVLLTLLYTVHYWLKRCVPKVSEAFFVYTDGAENILYLNSIMRSPTDVDDGSKYIYQGNNFEDDMYGYLCEKDKKKNCAKFFSKIFILKLFGKRKKKLSQKEEPGDGVYSFAEPRRIYSFTELEIRKMLHNDTTDACVQTGKSIEMIDLRVSKRHDNISLNSRASIQSLHKGKHINELNVLKFLKDVKSESVESSEVNVSVRSRLYTSINPHVVAEEKELHSTLYENVEHATRSAITSNVLPSTSGDRNNLSVHGRKRIRFEEGATMIPSADDNVDEENDYHELRRSVALGMGKTWRSNLNMDRNEENEEQSGGTGSDFMRFWGKGKKNKKKSTR